MLKYLVGRLLATVLVLVGIATMVFALTHLLPADPARVAAGFDAGPEQVEAVREALGLDRPLWEQYLIYMRNLAQLDLGRSIRSQQPVRDDLLRFAPASLELATISMVVLVVLAIPLGIVTATSGRLVDSIIRLLAIAGAAIPPFWLALLLQLAFYGRLGILPEGGRLDLQLEAPSSLTGLWLLDGVVTLRPDILLDAAKHLVLPVTALVLGRLALSVRLIRGCVLAEASKDYVRTARAKGLRERVVLYRHVLRNTMIPMLTIFGVQFGYLLGGAFLVEVIFLWPGLGRYAVDAIEAFDHNAVAGVTLLVAVYFTIVNLVLDLSYGLVDPRIRVRQ